ncbi:MAG: threonine/serine exporter family protein [Acidobacteriota bacterium]|nr:threonine/serine exporter family protein [Acidobacteriota bacterium]
MLQSHRQAVDDAEAGRFLRKLAGALHRYGTPVHRIEHALSEVAAKLSVPAQFLVTPTSIVTSIGTEGRSQTTLLRLDQGEADLAKLADLHDVLRDVFAGRATPAEASARLIGIEEKQPLYGPLANVVSFGVVSGVVSMFFGGGLREGMVALGLGVMVGVLVVAAGRSPRFALVLPAVAGIACASGAQIAAHWVEPLFPSIPTLAGLIVLLPGLTLTIAVNEMAHRHIVSGSARLASALITFLQIGFGMALGNAVAWRLFGEVEAAAPESLPFPFLAAALVVNAMALSVLFQARLKDAPIILAAAATAFLGARYGSEYLGLELGTCLGAYLVGSVGTIISRWRNIPSATPILPALLLLVPGSLGFRSLSALIAKDVVSGVEAGFTMAMIALALVTGLLLANLTIEPRKLF